MGFLSTPIETGQERSQHRKTNPSTYWKSSESWQRALWVEGGLCATGCLFSELAWILPSKLGSSKQHHVTEVLSFQLSLTNYLKEQAWLTCWNGGDQIDYMRGCGSHFLGHFLRCVCLLWWGSNGPPVCSFTAYSKLPHPCFHSRYPFFLHQCQSLIVPCAEARVPAFCSQAPREIRSAKWCNHFMFGWGCLNSVHVRNNVKLVKNTRAVTTVCNLSLECVSAGSCLGRTVTCCAQDPH